MIGCWGHLLSDADKVCVLLLYMCVPGMLGLRCRTPTVCEGGYVNADAILTVMLKPVLYCIMFHLVLNPE